jgi:DNA-directed RNA polymerase specialized sigma24 family protein
LSETTVTALIRDYQGGAALADLQRTYSLSRGSVQKLLRERGVRRRRRSLTYAERAVLVERYGAGMTIREIAVEQGLAKTTVQDALARTGTVMRPAVRRAPNSLHSWEGPA